ncbi:hypothetical protein CHUAL_002085 [Chamberlinius hualienensis]
MAFSSPGKKSAGNGIHRENKSERLTGCRMEKDEVERVHQHYIGKISELHNVIADLSKKIEEHKQKIREEMQESSHSEAEEEDDEDYSCNSHCSSNNNNLDGSCSGNEESVSDLPRAALVMSSPKNYSKSAEQCVAMSKVMCKDIDELSTRLKKVANDVTECSSNRVAKEDVLQMTSLQEELLILKKENDTLTHHNCQLEIDLNKTKTVLTCLKDERDRLRRKVRELHGKLQPFSTQYCGSQDSQTASPTKSHSSKGNASGVGDGLNNGKDDALVTKIAERIRLKRMEDGDRHILGSEISYLGVSSAKMAEHLVQHVKEESNAQEIVNAISSSGSQISDGVVREFELEMERMNSRLDHIKSQNDLLSLNLEESKSHCDRLSVLIGKYESNNTALQLALSYSDQALDTTEILLRLMETETALVVAKCHAAGLTNVGRGANGDSSERDEAAAILKHSHENRKAVEAAAKRLLQKLDRNFRVGSTWGDKPWEDASSHSHTASTTSSNSSHDCELTKTDEQRLRNYVIRLKNEKSLVRTTVTELESVHVDPVSKESSLLDAQKLDFENAVLMQELMALKEEKAEFKAQVYVLEKEKTALELKLDGRVAQEQAYIAHIEHLKSEVREQEHSSENSRNNTMWSEMDQAHCLEQSEDLSQSLVEAMHREKKLKTRIQELVTALDKVTRNSELRQQQSIEFVNELKRGNGALIATFERSKKKYQSKIKKLEQQIATLSERNMAQVRAFQQRISFLEEQIPSQKFQTPSETSL